MDHTQSEKTPAFHISYDLPSLASGTVILTHVFRKGFGNNSLLFVSQAKRKAWSGVLTQPADRTSISPFHPVNFATS